MLEYISKLATAERQEDGIERTQREDRLKCEQLARSEPANSNFRRHQHNGMEEMGKGWKPTKQHRPSTRNLTGGCHKPLSLAVSEEKSIGKSREPAGWIME